MAGRFDTAEANDRETVRLPEWMVEEMEQLVETGAYANKAEIHREALKEKLEAEHE